MTIRGKKYRLVSAGLYFFIDKNEIILYNSYRRKSAENRTIFGGVNYVGSKEHGR
jgi:hypothetical protein